MGVEQRTWPGTSPRISCVVSKSDSDHGTATGEHRTLGLTPAGTICHSNLSLSHYPLLGNTAKTFDEGPKVQKVVKGPLVLCWSNKYQKCLKMLVNLIIQNLTFYYIFDMRRNYGFNIQNIIKIHLLGFSK